jgi:hypothetical protein
MVRPGSRLPRTAHRRETRRADLGGAMEPTPAERVATGRIRYYLLCRHGTYGNGDLLTQTRDSAKEYPTDAIALRLAEMLADLSRGDPARRIRLGAIVHAETKAAKLTAEHIADTLTPLADEDTKYSYVVTPKLVEGTSGTDVKAVIDRPQRPKRAPERQRGARGRSSAAAELDCRRSAQRIAPVMHRARHGSAASFHASLRR